MSQAKEGVSELKDISCTNTGTEKKLEESLNQAKKSIQELKNTIERPNIKHYQWLRRMHLGKD